MKKIRNLELGDYSQYIEFIDSKCRSCKRRIDYDYFKLFFDNVLNKHHVILVVIDENERMIGTGTLFIETKLTHGGCHMGHIENILIDPECRSQGLGEKLVKKLLKIAKENSCYRTDLNCAVELENFYEKSGFKRNQLSMSVYNNE